MSCFDTVLIVCPSCGEKEGIQSKAGDCNLDEFDIVDCPPPIAGAIDGTEIKCKCGADLMINTVAIVTVRVVEHGKPRERTKVKYT